MMPAQAGDWVLLLFALVLAGLTAFLAAPRRDGRWRGGVGPALACVAIGLFAARHVLLRFDAVDVTADGGWRLRNRLGWTIGQLGAGEARTVDVECAERARYRLVTCELLVRRDDGRTWRSVGLAQVDVEARMAPLLAAEPGAPAAATQPAPRRWPWIAAWASLTALAMAGAWAMRRRSGRWEAALADPTRWLGVRLGEPARVTLEAEVERDDERLARPLAEATRAWAPPRLGVLLDDEAPARVALVDAGFPLPLGRVGARLTLLYDAGFTRAEGVAGRLRLERAWAAGEPLALFARAEAGVLVAHAEGPMVLADPALAARGEWAARADNPWAAAEARWTAVATVLLFVGGVAVWLLTSG